MSRQNVIVPVNKSNGLLNGISNSNCDINDEANTSDPPSNNQSMVSYIPLNGGIQGHWNPNPQKLPDVPVVEHLDPEKPPDGAIRQESFEISDYDTPESFKYRENLQLTFYKACGPLIKMMELFGMWNSYYIHPHHKSYKKLRGCRRIFNYRTYSFVVLCILWFNALRFVPSFFVGPYLQESRLYFKAIYIMFLLQCCLNSTLMFITTGKRNGIAVFFHHWEYAIQSNQVTAVSLKWVRRWSMAFAIIGVFFVIFHFLNHSAAVLGPVESVRNASNIFLAPFHPSLPLHIVVIVCNTYDFAVWIYSIFFFTLLAMALSRQFEKFDERLERSISRANAREIFPPDFEILRKQHEELAKAVKLADDSMFTYLNLFTYLTMAPLACFLLYNLLFSKTITNNYAAYIMYTIWLTSIFINVCVMSWIAALTSSKAHDPKEKVYRISSKNAGMNELLQVNMFMSRLSGEPIGFTIFDLVVLTKPFILTIGGLVLTYYAMISEVQTSDTPTLFE